MHQVTLCVPLGSHAMPLRPHPEPLIDGMQWSRFGLIIDLSDAALERIAAGCSTALASLPRLDTASLPTSSLRSQP